MADEQTEPPVGSEAEVTEVFEPDPRPVRRVDTALLYPLLTGILLVGGGLIAFGIGVALITISGVLASIVIALFIALGLDPLVRMFERRGLSRAWSIVIVAGGFLILAVVFLLAIMPTVIEQLTIFIQALPEMIAGFMASDFVQNLQGALGVTVEEAGAGAEEAAENPATWGALSGGLLNAGATVAGAISQTVIAIVLTLYFLASLQGMKNAFYKLAPAWRRPGITDLTEQITGSIGGFVIGAIILGSLNSVYVFVVYLILGLPFPALVAAIAFVLTLIPLVGSVLFWIVGTVIALIADPTAALIFAILYLIYMQVEAYFITPRVMGKAVSVPGALVVIGAMVGATLMGALGVVVAIPVTASVLLIIQQVVVPRQDRKLRPRL